MSNELYDIVIIGGSFGAVSAARALSETGRRVALVDVFAWIGGQATSQGLCVLDDFHDPISEKVGVNRSYYAFRESVRAHYRKTRKLSLLGASQLHFNPGNALCSHLAAEAHVAHEVVLQMLQPAVDAGRLTILTGWKIHRMERAGNRVLAAVFRPVDGEGDDKMVGERAGRVGGEVIGKVDGEGELRLEGKFFLDGTEMGDTFPLLGVPYMKGSESQAEFGERNAPQSARPQSIQSFTFCATVEWAPGEDNALPKPEGYEAVRDRQGFFLFSPGHTKDTPARMWEAGRAKEGFMTVPAWFYRSVIDPANFEDGAKPRTVINVPGNDYHERPLLESEDEAQVLEDARHLTRCYLYWLQNEAPRDEGGRGYPEIRPVPEATGTEDGIAMAPYIRESRRLRAHRIIRQQDVHRAAFETARARIYPDSAGLGGYWLDVHKCSGGGGSVWEPTAAYQIPLYALLTPELVNFAVAGKGLGVTQIANGAYRLHPEEWSIGEAAAVLADYCLEDEKISWPPRGMDLHGYQQRLARAGVPLYWYEDLPCDHVAFEAIQMLAVRGVWCGQDGHLRLDGEHSVCRVRDEFHTVIRQLADNGVDLSQIQKTFDVAHNVRKYDVMHNIYQHLEALAKAGKAAYRFGQEA